MVQDHQSIETEIVWSTSPPWSDEPSYPALRLKITFPRRYTEGYNRSASVDIDLKELKRALDNLES